MLTQIIKKSVEQGFVGEAFEKQELAQSQSSQLLSAPAGGLLSPRLRIQSGKHVII